jgi:hypothetical protein
VDNKKDTDKINHPTLDDLNFALASILRSTIEEANSIKLNYILINKNREIELEFRKIDDYETQLNGQQLDDIRKSIFEIAGEEFPLVLSQYYIKEANMTGTIQEIDKSKNRIWIVDDTKKNGQSENPEAIWVTLTDDAKIVSGPRAESKSFDDLRIGQQVKSWFYGEILTSYPSQAQSVKIEILPAYHN